jgi:hypothetical protein
MYTYQRYNDDASVHLTACVRNIVHFTQDLLGRKKARIQLQTMLQMQCGLLIVTVRLGVENENGCERKSLRLKLMLED